MSNIYKVACYWTMCGEMYIEADDVEEAVEKAYGAGTPLPDGEYLSDSFEVDDVECIDTSNKKNNTVVKLE